MNKQVMINIDETLLAKAKDNAKKRYMNLSTYIRQLVLKDSLWTRESASGKDWFINEENKDMKE